MPGRVCGPGRLTAVPSSLSSVAGQPWSDDASDEDAEPGGRDTAGATPFYLLTAVPNGERLELPLEPHTPLAEYPQAISGIKATLSASRARQQGRIA